MGERDDDPDRQRAARRLLRRSLFLLLGAMACTAWVMGKVSSLYVGFGQGRWASLGDLEWAAWGGIAGGASMLLLGGSIRYAFSAAWQLHGRLRGLAVALLAVGAVSLGMYALMLVGTRPWTPFIR